MPLLRLSPSSAWELTLVAFSAGTAAHLCSLLAKELHTALPLVMAGVGLSLFAVLHFARLRNGQENAAARLEQAPTPARFRELAAAHGITLTNTFKAHSSGVFWIHGGNRTGMLAVSSDFICTEALFAHELGHGVLNHVPRRFVFQFLLITTATTISSGALLVSSGPLPSLAAGVIAPSAMLINAWYCRRQEAQADNFARRLVGATALAEALSTLKPYATSSTDLLSTHPSLAQRITH